ncbi:Hcp family type VI secretion system effector [Zoogloea dura]|jgi:type VI secretion system secreted protein Hcp|uniref:Type VI secretion system tube protein Hcp n=1 Tax=Zoogloea dura TaxID=2728840 RepID=A0A848G105_9RHOO|nr:type VI secretion system tube protein Hcp [Zoogloea dura]NML24766.1 type VI secretion system tube protein Hcp [Zoogloea dura]
MAVDMFFKLSGIDGESKDSKHEKEIDVLAWSWGLSQSGSTHVSTGGGSGKVNVQDLSFTKWVDSASTALIISCCKGTHIDEAKLTVRKAGDSPLEYIKITLKDVLVSAVTTGGSGGEDRLTENVTLNFGQFKVEYTPQDKKGAGGGTKTAAWDIPANKPVG